MVYPQLQKYEKKYNASRSDLAFDTRKIISEGVRRRVNATSIAPTNWRAFLRINDNKTVLFRFLSQQCLTIDEQLNDLFCGFDDICQSNDITADMSCLSPCNHEEADTRIFLHAKDMVLKDFRKLAIRTVDTDVLIMSIGLFSNIGAEELWVDFGAGKDRRFFAVHEIHRKIGERRAKALLFFHAFTVCDQVSFLSHVTKSNMESLGIV